MTKYGQFCPVAKAAEILGEKWTLLIVRELLLGATRFSQIQRGVARISPTLLNKRLDSLQEAGIVVRRRVAEQRATEYQLTQAGRELFPIILQTAEWGMRWARGYMTDDELDVDLLMSDIQRRIEPEKLPSGQTVIKFLFTDLEKYHTWWIKVKDGEVDLCTNNPGTEVDVHITTDLKTMTEIWMGDLSITNARSDKNFMIVGPSAWLKNINAWLGLYRFAHVRPGK